MTLTLGTVLCVAGMVVAENDLIMNGSFETGNGNPGNGYINLPEGSTVIDGWVVSFADVDWLGTRWEASDGERSVDLNGNMAGGIAQTLVTVPDTRYRVRFDMAGNPERGPVIKELLVTAGSDGATFEFDTTGHSNNNMGWEPHTWEFVATEEATTLDFRSTTGGVCGPTLDNVSVVEARLGDLDGDGFVGVGDLLVVLSEWGDCPEPPEECPADLDGDGVVGFSDLLIVLGEWG